jgi:hypothetical protein
VCSSDLPKTPKPHKYKILLNIILKYYILSKNIVKNMESSIVKNNQPLDFLSFIGDDEIIKQFKD